MFGGEVSNDWLSISLSNNRNSIATPTNEPTCLVTGAPRTVLLDGIGDGRVEGRVQVEDSDVQNTLATSLRDLQQEACSTS